MKTLAAGWRVHADHVLPPTAGSDTKRSAELAFYAGATHLIALLGPLRRQGGITNDAWEAIDAWLGEAQERSLEVGRMHRRTRPKGTP